MKLTLVVEDSGDHDVEMQGWEAPGFVALPPSQPGIPDAQPVSYFQERHNSNEICTESVSRDDGMQTFGESCSMLMPRAARNRMDLRHHDSRHER